MINIAHRLQTVDGIPSIDQGTINGWYLSYNPDDGRIYVCASTNGIAAATFKDMRNAVQYARKHGN